MCLLVGLWAGMEDGSRIDPINFGAIHSFFSLKKRMFLLISQGIVQRS